MRGLASRDRKRAARDETRLLAELHRQHFAISHPRDPLSTNLLFAIAEEVHYQFDRVQLKKGVYSPQAHGDLELEQNMVRKLVLKVLSGEKALKMDVASFPADEEAIKVQSAASKALSEALSKGTLNVTVKREKPAA